MLPKGHTAVTVLACHMVGVEGVKQRLMQALLLSMPAYECWMGC